MGSDVTTIVDEHNLFGKATHDATRLLFLGVCLHVYTMKDNIMCHVASFFPVHRKNILTLLSG
jgi:hypothetical protein